MGKTERTPRVEKIRGGLGLEHQWDRRLHLSEELKRLNEVRHQKRFAEILKELDGVRNREKELLVNDPLFATAAREVLSEEAAKLPAEDNQSEISSDPDYVATLARAAFAERKKNLATSDLRRRWEKRYPDLATRQLVHRLHEHFLDQILDKAHERYLARPEEDRALAGFAEFSDGRNVEKVPYEVIASRGKKAFAFMSQGRTDLIKSDSILAAAERFRDKYWSRGSHAPPESIKIEPYALLSEKELNEGFLRATRAYERLRIPLQALVPYGLRLDDKTSFDRLLQEKYTVEEVGGRREVSERDTLDFRNDVETWKSWGLSEDEIKDIRAAAREVASHIDSYARAQTSAPDKRLFVHELDTDRIKEHVDRIDVIFQKVEGKRDAAQLPAITRAKEALAKASVEGKRVEAVLGGWGRAKTIALIALLGTGFVAGNYVTGGFFVACLGAKAVWLGTTGTIATSGGLGATVGGVRGYRRYRRAEEEVANLNKYHEWMEPRLELEVTRAGYVKNETIRGGFVGLTVGAFMQLAAVPLAKWAFGDWFAQMCARLGILPEAGAGGKGVVVDTQLPETKPTSPAAPDIPPAEAAAPAAEAPSAAPPTTVETPRPRTSGPMQPSVVTWEDRIQLPTISTAPNPDGAVSLSDAIRKSFGDMLSKNNTLLGRLVGLVDDSLNPARGIFTPSQVQDFLASMEAPANAGGVRSKDIWVTGLTEGRPNRFNLPAIYGNEAFMRGLVDYINVRRLYGVSSGAANDTIAELFANARNIEDLATARDMLGIGK